MDNVVIGSYRLGRKLGEGGMGAVYLAEHVLLGRRAAIKVLLPALSANEAVVQRFFNEARATTSIADPGIVQVFDFGYHSDGSAYIVMELLEGESLDERMRRLARLTPSGALLLTRQLAISLAAAHDRGIVHRDLKPENIFVVGDPAVTGGERPKILDFGIAKLAGVEPGRMKTRTGMLMGTPVYMSPEQCRGAADIDHRSDVYALGCVLFCMLTGRPPFDVDSMGEIIAAHLREPAPAPSSLVPGLPPALDALVLRCLAKPPAERFQSMRELAQALIEIESQVLGVPVYRSHLTPQPYTLPGALTTLSSANGHHSGGEVAPPRRRAGLIAGLGAAVIALSAIAMIGLGQRGEGTGAAHARTPDAAAPGDAGAVIDAGVATVAVDAAPVAPVAPVADAGVAAPEPARKRRRKRDRTDHPRSTTPDDEPIRIDREN